MQAWQAVVLWRDIGEFPGRAQTKEARPSIYPEPAPGKQGPVFKVYSWNRRIERKFAGIFKRRRRDSGVDMDARSRRNVIWDGTDWRLCDATHIGHNLSATHCFIPLSAVDGEFEITLETES